MYKFWYDYVKTKYGQNTKFYYMDTENFIAQVKTDDIYKDIAKDVETRFDTSNFELNRPLPKGKNKKVVGLMKHELGGEIMKEFSGLRAKIYSYLKGKNNKDKKAKYTKKCVIKTKLKFKDYKKCLQAVQVENKIDHLEANTIDVDLLRSKRIHKQ